MCTILTQFLISELDENRVKKKGKHFRCAADKIFDLIEKNFEFKIEK